MNLLVKTRNTREQILDAAVELFSERGFANVSIRDICEAASVTPPTIYHYFGNKDQLFEAVILRTLNLTEFVASLKSEIISNSTPELQLRAFIRHYLTSFPRDFFNPGLFLQSTTRLYGVSTQRVMSEFTTINLLAREIIHEGVQNGLFRNIQPDKMMMFLMNLLMSYVLGEVHYFQKFDPSDTADFIYDLVLNGICP